MDSFTSEYNTEIVRVLDTLSSGILKKTVLDFALDLLCVCKMLSV